MKHLFVPYEIALQLKEEGFDEPTAHCYMHTDGKEYVLELFSFFLGGEGTLSEIYEDEKNERGFKIFDINNEEYVYFNYNQDLRKLLARLYNGHEYMNDEKSYNMNIDSYTYEKWSSEEENSKKSSLPNYNNGDFDFTVYKDVISAPLYQQVIDWFKEKHKIKIHEAAQEGWFARRQLDGAWVYFKEVLTLNEAIEEALKLLKPLPSV